MKKTFSFIFIVVLVSSLLAQKNTRTPDNFQFIPEGKTYINNEEMYVNEFYIANKEVSNKEYRDFLEALKNYDNAEILEKTKVNHEGWKKILSESQSFVEHYFKDEAYNDYPVVNITKEAAEIYCKYLSAIYKEKYNLNAEFRLPSMEEFVRAAKGENKLNQYAWGSTKLKNKKNQELGNFKTNQSTITAPVESFNTNQFGLYNMSGNVAEMISKNGIAMGSSWNCEANQSFVENYINYDNFAPNVGFRPIMTLTK